MPGGRAAICVLLFAAAVALYWPVTTFDLITVDDGKYVSGNMGVKSGLSATGFREAFSVEEGNLIPLSRLSHTLDYALFGDKWGYHHATSVLIHALAGVLLFLFLLAATGDQWPSAFVAAVFLLHPLHVESVAWVSERKDVLCALFWFLALWLWVRYTDRPGPGRYALCALAFVLGLLSKPMIVTFPALLLVLDYWPLRRPITRRLVLEKLPFLALAGLASIVTILTQSGAGAVKGTDAYPIATRLGNAVLSLAHYQFDALWPTKLAFAYPFPNQVPAAQLVPAAIALIAVSAVVIRRRPLLVGWIWFLLTVLPVIGLIQVGMAGRANRYMYVPIVGLAIIVTWGVRDLVRARIPLAIAAILALIAMSVATRREMVYWRASEPLYRRAVQLDPANYVAWHYLALLYSTLPDRLTDALRAARESARIGARYHQLHELHSLIAMSAGLRDEAATAAETAIRTAPGNHEAWYSAGTTAFELGQYELARTRLEKSLSMNPNSARAHYVVGYILQRQGKPVAEILPHADAAVRLEPDNPLLRSLLGSVLWSAGRRKEALPHLEEAVRLDSGEWESQFSLGVALADDPARQGDAISHLEESIRLQKGNPQVHRALGRLLLRNPARASLAQHHLGLADALEKLPATSGKAQ